MPIALLTALLSACAPTKPPPPRLVLEPVGFADLAGWDGDRQAAALAAFRRSCAHDENLPGDRAIGPGSAPAPGFGTVADWRPACIAARKVAPGDDGAARAFFEHWFTPYLARNNRQAEGLFTGYFEPELHGARHPGGRYRVPLYRRPGDLVTVDLGRFRPNLKGVRIAGRVAGGRLRPYQSRAEIEAGALKGRGLELLWVDDPIDAFFLQIQGSGQVVMKDGGTVRVGYAASNGQPYVAIGRELVARGALQAKDVTMQSIRAWLAAHPDQAAAVMAANPAYVFFREIDGDGPIGAQGVVLTAGRSLAVDRRFLGLGMPIWLDTTDPLDARQTLRRLVVAQDTGGAIRGPVRGDLFWGAGAQAARRAGHMKTRGRYYLLLPRALSLARAR